VPFPNKLLNPGETIVLDLRPHWWRVVPASSLLGLTAIIGIVTLSTTGNRPLRVIAGLLVAAAVVHFVRAYVIWVSENFVVTSERVIHRSGVIAKRGIEIPLDRVNTVFFSQSLFERMLGAGDLGVESAGEGGQQTFNSVRKPNVVQQEIYRAMEASEQEGFQAMAQATATALGRDRHPVESSIPDQINQLDELRRRGVLTDAEFEAKKRELLDRM